MEGEPIKTLNQLKWIVDEKRAVVCPKSMCWAKPRPAAFMIQLSGTILLQLFRLGMFVYEKAGPVIDAEFEPKKDEVTNGKEENR